MRALGRLARSDKAATELVSAQGLPPVIALLDCSDPGLVRRRAPKTCCCAGTGGPHMSAEGVTGTSICSSRPTTACCLPQALSTCRLNTPCSRRCLVALYFVGADKTTLQAAMASAGAVAPAVRLCRSSQPEVQAEAADVLKVLARSPSAAHVIADLGAARGRPCTSCGCAVNGTAAERPLAVQQMLRCHSPSPRAAPACCWVQGPSLVLLGRPRSC